MTRIFNRYVAITIGTLFAIGLSLRGDEAKEPYNKDVRVQTLLRTMTNSAGQPIHFPDKGTPEVSVLIVTIAPGKQTGWHQHPVPLFGYVMAGEVTVHLDKGETHTFREGEAFAECVDLLHNGVNTGTVPTKLLIFVAGEKDVPFTVKEVKGKDRP
jgi:quercetin dioxygenase-like cupin family protein